MKDTCPRRGSKPNEITYLKPFTYAEGTPGLGVSKAEKVPEEPCMRGKGQGGGEGQAASEGELGMDRWAPKSPQEGKQ